MKTEILLCAAIVALLSVSTNVSAYHITGAAPGSICLNPTDPPSCCIYDPLSGDCLVSALQSCGPLGLLVSPACGSAHTWDAMTNIFSPINEPCSDYYTPIPDPLSTGIDTIAELWSFIVAILKSLPSPFGDLFSPLLGNGCLHAPAIPAPLDGPVIYAPPSISPTQSPPPLDDDGDDRAPVTAGTNLFA